MTTILNENITFSSIYTAFNGLHNGSDDILLSDFRNESWNNNTSVPSTGFISIDEHFKGKTTGGAGAITPYTYLKLNSKVWSFSRDGNTKNYGRAVAMSNKYFMVGNSTSGKAYFYTRESDYVSDSMWSSDNPWVEKAVLTGSTHFAGGVAVSDNGWGFVAQWQNPSVIYMYKFYDFNGTFNASYANAHQSLDIQGNMQVLDNILVVTDNINNKCIIYQYNGSTTWIEERQYTNSLAINVAGSGSAITEKWIIVVWGTGATCQIKIIANDGTFNVVHTIRYTDINSTISPTSMSTANSTFFGVSVGISETETELGYDYVMIGARPHADGYAGGVHIFKMTGTSTTHVSTIEQPGTSSNEGDLYVEYFAISMNASPYYLLIGCFDWTNETNYLFTRKKNETWETAVASVDIDSDYRHNNRAKNGHIMDRGGVNSYTNYALGFEQSISPDSNYILSSAYAGYVLCFKRVEDLVPPPPPPLSLTLHSSSNWSELSGDGLSQATPYFGSSTNHNNNSIGKIEFKVAGSGFVWIWSYVSSEGGYDYAHVFVNGSQKWRKAGNVTLNWTQYSVANGQIIEFKYTKDGSVSSGSDLQQMKIYISAT